MLASPTATKSGHWPPPVRKRLVRSQALPAILLPFTVLMAIFPIYGLSLISVLPILAGSLALGVPVGFFGARRLLSKADASGVYRRKMPSRAVSFVLVILASATLISILVLSVLLLPLSHAHALAWGFALVSQAFASGTPVGTLLVERRARSRLWVARIPSEWLPQWIEYRVEYHPGRRSGRTSAS